MVNFIDYETDLMVHPNQLMYNPGKNLPKITENQHTKSDINAKPLY